MVDGNVKTEVVTYETGSPVSGNGKAPAFGLMNLNRQGSMDSYYSSHSQSHDGGNGHGRQASFNFERKAQAIVQEQDRGTSKTRNPVGMPLRSSLKKDNKQKGQRQGHADTASASSSAGAGR